MLLKTYSKAQITTDLAYNGLGFQLILVGMLQELVRAWKPPVKRHFIHAEFDKQ